MIQKHLAIVGLAFFLAAGTARASLIEFRAAAQSVSLGSSLEVDVWISGLSTIGAFDLDVSFDPGILSPTAVTFGPFLGDPALLEADTFAAFLTGLIDFLEVSFLSDSELDALQPDSFLLATLSFDAIGLGTSALVFSDVLLADAFGDPLPSTSSFGSVTVTPAIPAPATAWLLALGLIGFFLRTHNRTSV